MLLCFAEAISKCLQFHAENARRDKYTWYITLVKTLQCIFRTISASLDYADVITIKQINSPVTLQQAILTNNPLLIINSFVELGLGKKTVRCNTHLLQDD